MQICLREPLYGPHMSMYLYDVCVYLLRAYFRTLEGRRACEDVSACMWVLKPRHRQLVVWRVLKKLHTHRALCAYAFREREGGRCRKVFCKTLRFSEDGLRRRERREGLWWWRCEDENASFQVYLFFFVFVFLVKVFCTLLCCDCRYP